MFDLETPVLEIVLRTFVTYVALSAMFRATARKDLGRMTPMDLVLTLIVSATVSRALTGDDRSVTAALVAAATLLGTAAAVSKVTTQVSHAAITSATDADNVRSGDQTVADTSAGESETSAEPAASDDGSLSAGEPTAGTD